VPQLQLNCPGIIFMPWYVLSIFLIKKGKTCTTISHVPQKATITETGKASLSDQCSVPL
jgi:hypothetical protein